MSTPDLVTTVQTYLATEGFVDGATGWPSVRRFDHDETDRLVILTEDGGPSAEIGSASGIGDAAFFNSGLQVRVRAKPQDGDSSHTKAKAILDHFHGRLNVEIGGTTFLRIISLTPVPVFIGFDENRRPSHTVSLRFLGGQAAAP